MGQAAATALTYSMRTSQLGRLPRWLALAVTENCRSHRWKSWLVKALVETTADRLRTGGLTRWKSRTYPPAYSHVRVELLPPGAAPTRLTDNAQGIDSPAFAAKDQVRPA
jgi:hypothetical protein